MSITQANDLTWTCMVCGKRRPDSSISVFTRDDSHEYGMSLGSVKTNIRHCNDNNKCPEGAKTVDIFKKKIEPKPDSTVQVKTTPMLWVFLIILFIIMYLSMTGVLP